MAKRMGSLTKNVLSTVTLDGIEMDVTLEVHYDYTPGSPATGISGPPENYDPGEEATVDITGVYYLDADIKGNLTALELETIANEIEEWEIENALCTDSRFNG